MTETPAIKTMNQQKGTPSRKRDDEFWFDDGTIVLVIQDTEFRVYRGLLQDRFPMFKELLSLPQPAICNTEDQCDYQCPVVHLCDYARDWRNVFRLYMPRSDTCFFHQGPPCPSFDTLASCVRLGHKYDMVHIQREALDYLKTLFHPPLYRQTIMWPPHGFVRSSAIGVVNLARLTEAHTLLPVALFKCCQLTNITQGFVYSDGEREMLSSEDLERCLVARSKLMQETYGKYTRSFLAVSDTSRRRKKPCRSNNTCFAAAACKKFFTVANNTAYGLKHPEPFLHLEAHLSDDVRNTTFCDPCWEMFRECEEEEHKALWKRLPSFFGLDLANWGQDI
ncbi:hypothetical protein C8T65DRAFT_154055 [Cerioporus squamosus]|nr:hypothetical protein C8T65DRAFT_154055 [Cerioporus squamosus]